MIFFVFFTGSSCPSAGVASPATVVATTISSVVDSTGSGLVFDTGAEGAEGASAMDVSAMAVGV
jgi:hypothetical protein